MLKTTIQNGSPKRKATNGYGSLINLYTNKRSLNLIPLHKRSIKCTLTLEFHQIRVANDTPWANFGLAHFQNFL